MMSELTNLDSIIYKLTTNLDAARLEALSPEQVSQFCKYLELMVRWNAKTNLTSVREEGAIIERHFVECIACAQNLPKGISTLLDVGSGAGLPGIPIAICRPEIVVTLAESQNKKAAFLQEAVRVLGIGTKVHAQRAEEIQIQFDCVTLRAVDRMEQAVRAAVDLVRAGGWLVSMTTMTDRLSLERAAGAGFTWKDPVRLPGGENRVLELGLKSLAGR
jgi:16S rRNA (guanine527-N7)-methyltransferase